MRYERLKDQQLERIVVLCCKCFEKVTDLRRLQRLSDMKQGAQQEITRRFYKNLHKYNH